MSVRVSFPQARSGIIRFVLLTLVVIYGAIAGLQTVADFDLGWQMADARAPFSSTDVLSYTAPGAPWIYPPLAGFFFQKLFSVGGYDAISWFCVLALLITLGIISLRSKATVLLLVLLAVPVLARQMIPRSGLFTVVIAVAFVRVLLHHYRKGGGRKLWLLPVLMTLWGNLHTGFIAGLGLMLGYLAAEAADWWRVAERETIQRRLKVACPWIIATAACTLLNPWGPRIYSGIATQEHISKLQSAIIVELVPLYRDFTWRELNPLVPLSALWWLLAISAISIALLVYQKRVGLALFLGLAFGSCLLSARTQGVFVPIACLVAGDALNAAKRSSYQPEAPALWPVVRMAGVAAISLVVAWRCSDIVTDRSAVREGQVTLFGAGASWWLPQEAANFVEEKHLPTELFSTFNLSSYLTWRLGPHYRDFADGRYFPFGDRIVSEQLRLASLPLDSDAWSQAAATYHIQTIIFPLSRFFGVGTIPLQDDCKSHHWLPVYFDSKAVVFVRKDAMPQAQLSAMEVDCQQQQLVKKIDSSPEIRTRMEQYQMLANSAVIYFLLGRRSDAARALADAERISHDDDSLVLLRGQLQAAQGKFDDAEISFRDALHMHDSDAAWYQLGLLCANEGRYPEAVSDFRHAMRLSTLPNFDIEWALARAEVLDKNVSAALQTLEDAERLIADSGPSGATARANVDDVEAAAYSQLSEWSEAVAAEEQAVHETPLVARRWNLLAALYAAAGQQDHAEGARRTADALAKQVRP